MPGNLNRESSPAVARAAAASNGGGDGGHPAPSPRNSVVGNGSSMSGSNGTGSPKVTSAAAGFKSNGDHSKGLSPARMADGAGSPIRDSSKLPQERIRQSIVFPVPAGGGDSDEGASRYDVRIGGGHGRAGVVGEVV